MCFRGRSPLLRGERAPALCRGRIPALYSGRSPILHDDRGQAIVEMALVLAVLLLLLTGIMEFGRVLSAQIVVSYASREGARVGILGKTDAEITEAVLHAASSLDESKISVTITPPQSGRVRGAELRVEAEYTVDIVVPLLNDMLPNPYPVRGVTTMRVE